jgi:hypothetical protein
VWLTASAEGNLFWYLVVELYVGTTIV